MVGVFCWRGKEAWLVWIPLCSVGDCARLSSYSLGGERVAGGADSGAVQQQVVYMYVSVLNKTPLPLLLPLGVGAEGGVR